MSAALAHSLHQPEDSLRQRLREWCYDRADKRGSRRAELAVSTCFAPLLGWVVSLWAPTQRRMVLALDATALKQVFVVLSISVLYRGSAIPVAWAVLPGAHKGAWQGHWLRLLGQLQGRVPPDWQVLVLADRGLYAAWLFEAIRANGWHPFLRLHQRGSYCPLGQARFRPLSQLLNAPGSAWAGRVHCFAHHTLTATLLACWEAPYRQPWLILTDLPPEQASAHWYGLRSWIEGGFKDLKRDGWQWQRTRAIHPARADRLWLALAVATLWVLSVGGEADLTQPEPRLERLPERHIARRTARPHRDRPRRLSCFSRGLSEITHALMVHLPVAPGGLYPEPFPSKTYP